MYKLYSKMIKNTSWVHHFMCKILLLIIRIFTLCEKIQIYEVLISYKISILIYFVWNKIVCLEDFVELSIFNFVVVHNRKIPRGLKETHKAGLYLSGL